MYISAINLRFVRNSIYASESLKFQYSITIYTQQYILYTVLTYAVQ